MALRTVQMSARSNLWFDELALELNVRERGFLELASAGASAPSWSSPDASATKQARSVASIAG